MKIGMIGMGKLGLPVALAIESKGHEVIGYDISTDPYVHLATKTIPYKEDYIDGMLYDTEMVMTQNVIDMFHCDIIFVAVQTPHEEKYDGSTLLPDDTKDFDYTHLIKAIKSVSEYTGVLAVISTCLPNTYNELIKELPKKYHYVYTPQFIAMGTVVNDYLDPEFNLIGVEDEDAADALESFYKTINDAPVIRTDITTAEGIKVSYNTWITAKTVIANVWGEIAQKTGMNFDDMHKAWSLSTKRLLSPKYMKAGMSDGGGCHPRDNIALSHLAKKLELSHDIFNDLMTARQDYEMWHAQLALEKAQETGLPLILLGKAFKPETNIETGSPAILMANILKQMGVKFEHYEDMDELPTAVYFIATNHEKYDSYDFTNGSTVINPFDSEYSMVNHERI